MKKVIILGVFFLFITNSSCFADPETKDPSIVTKNGRYEKLKNGIVYDKKTDLEWVVGPDKCTYGHTAKYWVAHLDLDGGGWRMPSKDELKGLYKKGFGSRNMVPFLVTKGWKIYSKDTKGKDDISGFDFKSGYSFDYHYSYFNNFRFNEFNGYDSYRDYYLFGRAFAVRARR